VQGMQNGHAVRVIAVDRADGGTGADRRAALRC
jgi:hypothetical protein